MTALDHHELIAETANPAKRLGRHVYHDQRSRSYATKHTGASLVSAEHVLHGGIRNQGGIGRCTGFALRYMLMTEGQWVPGRNLTDDDADEFYRAATHIDHIPGVYPPDDTGSTGIAVAKVAKLARFVDRYEHAFSLDAALAALGRGATINGIPWYSGFDSPIGSAAELKISGKVRGGHEICLNKIDVAARMVRGPNSWGEDFGDKGYFVMSFDTYAALLAERGDCTTFR